MGAPPGPEPYYPDTRGAANEICAVGRHHRHPGARRVAPDGPFGAKGPGEMCANPVLPAVANAVFNAVGVRINDLPITPEKILRALKARGGAAPAARPR